MTRRCFIECMSTLPVLLTALSPAEAAAYAASGLTAYYEALADYIALRRSLDTHLPPLAVSHDAGRIHDAVEARAAAIRRARAGRPRGEIFNAEVAELFRGRIRDAFSNHGPDAVGRLLRDMTEDGGRWQPAAVNGRFSWDTAVATPPAVLMVLPSLPGALQYRFIGRDLALVDTDADLVIDVVLKALDPPARSRQQRAARRQAERPSAFQHER